MSYRSSRRASSMTGSSIWALLGNIILSPRSKLTEDNISSHMKSIESVAHHERPVQGRGSIAPVRAKRWEPSRKGSAPTAEWVGQ
ncbi:hypothetical protein [Rothia aeria]|uniref:hypothetical protein n=1 Tax=Rothia aeria TaxID=172042 RepID=UPI00103B4C6B|nr:hypothetical protein [Rothia aeria]